MFMTWLVIKCVLITPNSPTHMTFKSRYKYIYDKKRYNGIKLHSTQ